MSDFFFLPHVEWTIPCISLREKCLKFIFLVHSLLPKLIGAEVNTYKKTGCNKYNLWIYEY